MNISFKKTIILYQELNQRKTVLFFQILFIHLRLTKHHKAMEETKNYKSHLVYAAAMLAKQLHSGQKDKGGNDYFTSHLLKVGKSGFDWKEKVVGFLHDAAEDTDIDVPTIIARLKEQENNNPTVTDDEWNEIATALNLLNHHLFPTREEYIAKIKNNRLAVRVKMHDLENNMDISRIPNPTEKDFARLERYKKEYQELAEVNCFD